MKPQDLSRFLYLTEPVIGYRFWAVASELRIRSFYRDVTWQPRKPVYGHVALQNEAGVYALRSFRPYNWTWLTGRYPTIIWGAVYLWGKIVVHTQGYRAQYGYPAKLYIQPWTNKMGKDFIRAIADEYGCEVEESPMPTLQATLELHHKGATLTIRCDSDESFFMLVRPGLESGYSEFAWRFNNREPERIACLRATNITEYIERKATQFAQQRKLKYALP